MIHQRGERAIFGVELDPITTPMPEFWGALRDGLREELPIYRNQLKAWPLVQKIPLWYGVMTPIEFHYYQYVRDVARRANPLRQQRIIHAAAETMWGHPDVESYKKCLVWPGVGASPWSVKSLHHILKAEEKLGPIGQFRRVVEIGPGIGELQRVLRAYGFDGEQVCFDFPEVLEVQKAYLQGMSRMRYIADPYELTDEKSTLVFATWSLSEMPFHIREQVVELLRPASWFVIFQAGIGGMNNIDWFTKRWDGLVAPGDTHFFSFEPMEWHPYQGGSTIAVAGRARG